MVSNTLDRVNLKLCLFFITLGRAWAAATTEGLLIYSLDSSIVFSPYDLDIDITHEQILDLLHQKEYTAALVSSLRLNEDSLIQRVLENIQMADSKY